MRKIRDVLRYRHSTGLSLEAIARALSISKGVVAKYLRLASDAGLGWPLPEDLDDAGLEKRLYRQPSARISAFAEPDYAQVHQELKRKGVTLTLLWEEYRHEVGDIAYQSCCPTLTRPPASLTWTGKKSCWCRWRPAWHPRSYFRRTGTGWSARASTWIGGIGDMRDGMRTVASGGMEARRLLPAS